MAEIEFGYREVIGNQTISPRWRDITVNIGAAQGTLQDIKRPDACGGYCYKDSNYSSKTTRNRFIYWRISHDVLEISEESLDVDLTGNHVCLRFQDTPVLDGVGLHEDLSSIVILIATVSSVHRIILPHPHRHNQDCTSIPTSQRVIPSVLAELTASHVREPSNCYVLNWSGVPGMLPHSSACWLNIDGDAYFALACNVGSILLVHLPRADTQGSVVVRELRHSTVIQRVWTGIVPSIMRFGMPASDAALSLCFHVLDKALTLFALCRDSKIRMWSIKEQDCVIACDLLQMVLDSGTRKQHQMGQRHILRKAVGSSANELVLGVFLNFLDRSQFIILQLVNKSGQYCLEHLTSLYSPEFDLTDFWLTPHHLWALWSNIESEPVLRYAVIDSYEIPFSGWSTVNLEAPVGREFHLPEGLMDPREAYCQYIFYPGRFSLQTITKAINIYRRSADLSYLSEINAASATTLYEEVTATVEMEIQSRASEYELSDEQYLQLQQDCWSKFYLGCIQYHQVGTKPMGLFGDASTGLMCLIKKNTFSLLRCRDIVELLFMASDEEVDSVDFSTVPTLPDPLLTSDLMSMFRCLCLIRSVLSVEHIHDFKYDMFHLTSPETIAHDIVDVMFLGADSLGVRNGEFLFISKMGDICQSVKHLQQTIQAILSAIDLAHGAPQDLTIDNLSTDAACHLIASKLFSSKLGSSILSESIHQIVHLRFELCRDLLIFLELIGRTGSQIGISAEIREAIHSYLIPQTSIMTQAYFILCWFCETIASPVTIDTVDAGARQLAILDLSESSLGEPKSAQPVLNPLRLVELFIQGDGGSLARIILAQENILNQEPCKLWVQAFLPLACIVAQLVWPITVNVMFPEFLITQCQYMQLQEYVRLLQHWCEWNSCSRKFLCGYAHVIQGEPDKALDWFLAAADGLHQEDFIVSKVLQAVDSDPSQLMVLYYLKVIRFFEQYMFPEHVISLANTAINSVQDSSHLTTLGTLLFKNVLELGHDDDAYAAMMAIPDYSRKKDCLRQFIVTLFERHQLKTLIEYPYPDMHDEVVEIIESRARSIDLTVHNYYDLLYSFHVFRENFRRAGSVMYEYGMRLGNEVPGLKGLQKQAKCYLAAMNCLHLVAPIYAWIVKPLPMCQPKNEEFSHPGMSPKRSSEGGEIMQADFQRQIALVQLSDIKNEYELILARLKLMKKDPDPAISTGPAFSAEELVVLLCKVGLFDVAVRLCKKFKLSLHPVFDALTVRCVHLMRTVANSPSVTDEAWEWLAENESLGLRLSSESSVTDHAWHLLRLYLETYEEKRQVTYHRCIVIRLLSLDCPLPDWLTASYKKYDPADLLRRYLKFEMLENASNLVIEYVDAVLGKGKENFGLQTHLAANAPPVWLPYTAIDNLLSLLSESADKDPTFSLLKSTLEKKLQDYHHQVEIASRDMIFRGAR